MACRRPHRIGTSPAVCACSAAPDGRKLHAAALEGNVLHEGQQIGSYCIRRRIGAGGMGQVFEGFDLRLNRRVAVKVLSPAMSADPGMARRFEQEARLASALNHANILTVHDIGEWDGRRYIVTEFVEGETLRRRLARSPMDEGEILSVIHQAGSGLRTAHEAGIVQRDMKPEIIMLRPDGVVRVLDFGLAKPSGPAGLSSHILVGTIPHMAPEQLRRDQIDARADIWSLGAIFYEMIAGQLPESYPPPALPRRRARLEPVIRRALHPDRDLRYASVAEFLTDLDASGSAVRRLPLRGLAAAAAVLLVAFAVWRVAPWSRPGEPELVRVTRLTTTGRTMKAAISSNARFLAYNGVRRGRSDSLDPAARRGAGHAARRSLSRQQRSGASPTAATIFITRLDRPPALTCCSVCPSWDETPAQSSTTWTRLPHAHPTTSSLRSFAWRKPPVIWWRFRQTAPANGSSAERVSPYRFRPSGPAWSPDGSRIATAVQDSANGKTAVFIVLYNAQGGTGQTLGPTWADIDRLAWTSDGHWLFVPGRAEADSNQVYRVSASDGERNRITSDLSNFFDVTVQKDGNNISALRSDRTAYISLGSPPRRLKTGMVRYSDIAAGASGLMTISNASGAAEIWTLGDSGAERRADKRRRSQTQRGPMPGRRPRCVLDERAERAKYLAHRCRRAQYVAIDERIMLRRSAALLAGRKDGPF